MASFGFALSASSPFARAFTKSFASSAAYASAAAGDARAKRWLEGLRADADVVLVETTARGAFAGAKLSIEGSPDGELDGAFAVLRARHDLCVLAVSTVDGRLLASCGDAESSRALAAFAQLVLGRAGRDASRTMHCGRMHLERVDLLGEACVVTAMATSVLDDPAAIADALRSLYAGPPAPSPDAPQAIDGDWSFDADFLT